MSDIMQGRHGEPVSDEIFRAAFRALASGVVVVTCWVDDRPWGMTINSCCSVSTSPCRVLISLQRRTRTCMAIEQASSFGLNLLASDQKRVAESAAVAGQPKFLDSYCAPRERDRPPLVRSSIWCLECTVDRTFGVGDHVLIVGGVGAVTGLRSQGAEAEPLLYFNRTYRLIGRQL